MIPQDPALPSPARINLPLVSAAFLPYLNPSYPEGLLRAAVSAECDSVSPPPPPLPPPPQISSPLCLRVCVLVLAFVSPSSVFDEWHCLAELGASRRVVSGDRNSGCDVVDSLLR